MLRLHNSYRSRGKVRSKLHGRRRIRRLRHEGLEDRRLLAAFVVNMELAQPSTSPWAYEGPVQFNHAGGNVLSDYQISVTVDTASLISEGKLRPDCGDLRFVNDNQELSYWMESGCNTSDTLVWVKVNEILPGDNEITLLYGNPAATSASDGESTFLFFEGFDGNELDTDKWTVEYPRPEYYGTPEITVGDGVLTFTGGLESGRPFSSIGTAASDSLAPPVVFQVHMRRDSGSDIQAKLVYPGHSTATVGIRNYGTQWTQSYPSELGPTGLSAFEEFGVADNDWHKSQYYIGGPAGCLYSDIVDDPPRVMEGVDVTGQPGYFRILTWGSHTTMQVDHLFARQLDTVFEGVDCPVSNQPPTNISLSGTEVDENVAVGSVIGTLSATDPDPGETFIFSETADPDGKFSVVDNELRVDGALDFETATSHSVTVRVTDSGGAEFDKQFTISVNDIHPIDGPAEVIDAVQTLNDSGVLNNGQANPVINHLDQAIKDWNKGKTSHAIQKLEQARDEIQDLIDDGDLTSAQGQPLVDSINDVINEMLTESAQPASALTDNPLQPNWSDAVDQAIIEFA